MQLSFGFGFRTSQPPDARNSLIERLAVVLRAARRTPLYGPLMARAGAGDPAEVLSRLPLVGIHAWLQDRQEMRAAKPAAQPRDVIRGSLGELLHLAARVEAGRAPQPGGLRVIVRTALGERLASEQARDSLWHAFELPVFEELTGAEGEVFAAECEAHTGMHLTSGAAIFEACYGELVVTSLGALRYPVIRLRTGWVGAIDQCGCPCGEQVARFLPVTVPASIARKPPAAERSPRRAVERSKVLSPASAMRYSS